MEKQLQEAKLALQDREKKLAEAYEQIEHGLILLGATAVEDRLVFFFPYMSNILFLILNSVVVVNFFSWSKYLCDEKILTLIVRLVKHSLPVCTIWDILVN